MEANELPLAETPTARRLRLVGFYLPRLLVPVRHPAPEQWLQALSLWQLAEAVLRKPHWPDRLRLAGEEEVALHRLDRLRAHLWAQLSIAPERRDLYQESADWEWAQVLLRQTLALVEARLRATLADEERLRTQAPNFSGPVWSMPGLAWRVD
jgi:hypothetical protein